MAMLTGYHHTLNKEQQHKQEEVGYQNMLIPVAWAILVMGYAQRSIHILIY
jgi:hypothetical protein